MSKVIKTTVYQFDELDEDAKDKAREWYCEGALDYEWWDATYEDAERAGLKLTEFDLGGRRSIDGHLIVSMEDSITAILKDHGKDCDTYKLATEYKAGLDLLDRESDDYEDELERMSEEYTKALCEEYLALLDREIEYLLSDESVDETIRCNEYEFTKEGKRFVVRR